MSDIDNKQDDTDVIRAQDIVPPYNKEKSRERSLQTTESADEVLNTSEIPKFDLAEQIMAEQRKVTAIRRKAPGKKTKAPDLQPRLQSAGCAVRRPARTLPGKELIIAEIVARDIEKLYRGDSSSLRNW
ncbi:MAG: hypothetical protein RQ760_01415 [Sedimentisphaerales bacterium]|nr:hypothetical protein [Sedimentisphaerales bacterium]